MRRTKNMYYGVTEESNELELFTLHDSWTSANLIKPVIVNLKKHYVKGNFDGLKAIWSFYCVACAAAKLYKQEISTEYRFPVQARWTVAEVLLEYYMEDIESEA